MDNENQRSVLRRYLLSELSAEEGSQLADQYFVNEELFDELLDVENELLDQYVRKQLSPAESKCFSDYLRRLPEGANKLATAYALMEAANELREVAEPARLPFAEVVSRWQVVRHWLVAHRYALRYATVVVLIALIAGLFYLSLNQWRRDTEQEARSSQPEQTPPHNQTTEPQTKGSGEQRDTPSTKKRNKSRDTALASLILTPAMRSGGTPDSLTLSPDTKTVSLDLPIPHEERVASYSAVLQTTSGRIILSNVRLRPRASNGRTVSLHLSASQLASETHKLTLVGKAADGTEVAAYDYYFKIVRKQ